MFKELFLKGEKKILKDLQDILDSQNDTIEMLEKEIEDLKSGVAYEHLQKAFDEFKHQTIVYLSDKELKAYDNYCKEHKGNSVVIRQDGCGIGVCTYLNYVDKEGNLVGKWKDITDISVW